MQYIFKTTKLFDNNNMYITFNLSKHRQLQSTFPSLAI